MGLGTTFLPLQSCPICASLPVASLHPVAAIASELTANPGEHLMMEGEKCDGFFVVLTGRIRIYKASEEGREKALVVAERGMSFGEDALFGEGIFLETAVALEKSRLLRIPRKEFLSMLRKNPDLSFQVMESLCGWIRRLSASVETTAFLGARDRVIQYLLELKDGTESRANDLLLLERKKDIADRLGMTPETFSRVLHALEHESLIDVTGRKIQLLNIEALSRKAS